MATCPNCQANVPEGTRFCSVCGAEVHPTSSQRTAYAEDERVVVHNHVQMPVMTPENEPLSTGAWLGIMILMSIPFLNIVLLIIWACGGCQNRNRINFARGNLLYILIIFLIEVLLAVIAFIIMSIMGVGIASLIPELERYMMLFLL